MINFFFFFYQNLYKFVVLILCKSWHNFVIFAISANIAMGVFSRDTLKIKTIRSCTYDKIPARYNHERIPFGCGVGGKRKKNVKKNNKIIMHTSHRWWKWKLVNATHSGEFNLYLYPKITDHSSRKMILNVLNHV